MKHTPLLECLRIHRDSAFSLGTRLKRCPACRKMMEITKGREVGVWKVNDFFRLHDRSVLEHHGRLPLWIFRLEGGNPDTYYIDTAGDNGDAGSEAAPWATFSFALTQMVAGDVLKVNAGTYVQSITVSSKAGTSGSHYTMEASDSGNMPIIKPGGGNRALLIDHASDYWDWGYLIFDGTGVGFDTAKIDRSADPSTNNTFTNCHFRNSPTGQGMVTTDNCNNHTFTNCDFYGNGNSKFEHGLYYSGASGTVVGGSAYNNYGYGYHFYPPTTGCTIDRAIGYDNDVANEFGAGALFYGSDNTCRNSIFYGNATGIETRDGTAANPNRFFNVTVVDNAKYGAILRGHVHLKNVVYYTQTSYANEEEFTDGSSVLTEATNHKQTDGDPGFTDIANNDYHISSGSALTDAGTDLTSEGVTVDYDGNTRSGTYDIGAYEYTGATLAMYTV